MMNAIVAPHTGNEAESASMNEVFTETLHSWQNFYFMAGGTAATLIGLMFVTLSMGTHLISENTKNQIRLFVTPSVTYFISALLISCVMLVPTFTPPVLAFIAFLGGVMGLVNTIKPVIHLIKMAKQHQDFTLWDWLAQVILPPASYALLIIAAICFLTDQWPAAFLAVWIAIILLLLCAIANTWSLVIWIIDQRKPSD